MKWNEKQSKEFNRYLNSAIDLWVNEYRTSRKNYIKDTFIKLVGLDFFRFLKSFNKRLKLDIDSVPGLSDYLFEEKDGDSTKYNPGSIFFKKDGFELVVDEDTNTRNLSVCLYRDENESIDKYFDNTNDDFNDIDSCKHFSAIRNFCIEIIDDWHDRNSSGSSKIVSLMNFYDDYYLNIGKFLRNFQVSVFNTDTYQSVTIILSSKLHIRFVYRNDYRPVGDGSKLKITSDPQLCSSNYSELYRFAENNITTIFIHCRKPIFNDEQCKFFHVYEKIHRYYGSWESDYCKQFDFYNLETQFLDQLYLKYAFIGNDTIQEVLKFLNTTKDPLYQHSATDSIGGFAEWMPSGARQESYDKYMHTTSTYNVELQNKLPTYLDFVGKCLLDNLILYHKYGHRANEAPDRQQDRVNATTDKNATINVIIDECNLKRDSYFKEILRNFQLKILK